MTTLEMSNEFDVLYNNITSNLAPGLDEYEKSVFLTKAQRQLITEYFNNRTDVVGGGFDGSQKRLYDFSELIRTAKLFNVNTFKDRISPDEKFDRRSRVFLFPLNYFLAVNELVSDYQYQYSVIPLDYAEYQRLMFRPYNLPVKRGAWRIITDKKNCNYKEVFVEDTHNTVDTSDDTKTPINYVILTSWADLKRNMEITLKSLSGYNNLESTMTSLGLTPYILTNITSPDGTHPEVAANNTLIFFKTYYDEEGSNVWRCIACDADHCKWKDDHKTYEVSIELEHPGTKAKDDYDTIELFKLGFNYAKQYFEANNLLDRDWRTVKVMTHMDGFSMCSAPSKFTNFQTIKNNQIEGMTFTTECIKLPMVEIIGNFQSEPEYKLRYVRTLKPIILANLDNYGDNLTIDGVSQETNCELPEEAHQEIVERAVTLAKIAWLGATATLVAALQLLLRDRDNH